MVCSRWVNERMCESLHGVCGQLFHRMWERWQFWPWARVHISMHTGVGENSDTEEYSRDASMSFCTTLALKRGKAVTACCRHSRHPSPWWTAKEVIGEIILGSHSSSLCLLPPPLPACTSVDCRVYKVTVDFSGGLPVARFSEWVCDLWIHSSHLPWLQLNWNSSQKRQSALVSAPPRDL